MRTVPYPLFIIDYIHIVVFHEKWGKNGLKKYLHCMIDARVVDIILFARST